MSRLIDADALLKGYQDHERISTHLVWNAPTVTPNDHVEKISEEISIDIDNVILKAIEMTLESIDAIPIAWLEDQAKDTPYQHRVDGLIERWRREHEDN